MLTQACTSNTTPLLPVSEYEEDIWMLQLQQPEQVSRNINAWQVIDKVNVSLLTQVIQNIIVENPDLNARYHFNDEGDLIKSSAKAYDACLSSLVLEAHEVVNYLAKLKEAPWDAANNPPFNASILQTEEGIILALDLHPIIDQSYTPQALISLIQDHYQQLSIEGKALTLTEVELSSVASPKGAKPVSEVAHLTLTKAQIADIILEEFRSALLEPEMTMEDDFFDYGGHSLLATRIIGKLMQSYGIEVSFNDFFKASSAMALAEYANARGHDDQKNVTKAPFSADSAPLTLAQDFLWQAYSAYEFSPIYNLPFAIAFLDKVDETIFFQAFRDIVVRHAGLRTRFHIQQGKTTQHIIPTSELSQYQWFWHSHESQGISLTDEAGYQFDLTGELPLRVRFIPTPAGEPQVLSFLVHHMVIDEWSLNTIMADLSHAYMARANQQVPSWEAPVPSINDFAHLQQKQGVNRQHLDYWTQMLEGAKRGLTLFASDQQVIDNTNEMSTKAEWLELDLGAEAFNKLSAFARRHGSSIFGVLYTVITLSLHKQGDLDEIVIGTSAAGRTEADFFDTVGYFTTMVAHRIQFNRDHSIESLLKEVSDTINESMSYADIPINLIQQALGLPIDEGLLFDVYIHIHANNALHGQIQAPEGNIRYQQIPPQKNDSMFGLHFEIMDNVTADGLHDLRLVTTYQQERYSRAQVEAILANISKILALLDAPDGSKTTLKQIDLKRA